MSDEQAPQATPPPETPATPAPAPTTPAATPAAAPKPGTTPTTPPPRPAVAIEYALPTQKKSWLPTPERVRQIGCLLKLIVGFTVLIILGYFALVALNPKARQWALQGTKAGPGGAPPSGKGPTPFKAVNQILAIPAQALGKTDDVVKANNARVGQLDGVIKEEEDKTKGKVGRTSRPVVDPFSNSTPAGGTSRPDKSAGDADTGPQSVSGSTLLALAEKQQAAQAAAEDPAPAEPKTPAPRVTAPAAPVGPDEMKLPGDIVIARAAPAGAPRASNAFFYAIVKLTVSGITQGTPGKPGRALINNRLTYEGDELNRALGITFSQLDAANKQLVFRDQTGATVTRSY